MSRAFSKPLRRSVGPAVILLVVVLSTVTHFAGLRLRGDRSRLIRGDAVHYYVYLRSLVFDRDLHFANDYRHLYSLDSPNRLSEAEVPFDSTPTGHVRNVMAIGTPLFWSIPYLLLIGALSGLSVLGISYPIDGYAYAFQIVPDVAGLAACGLALWFTYRLLEPLAGAAVALFSVLAAFGGTSLLYYTLVAPSYSHAVSAMATSAFLLAWWRTRQSTSLVRYAMLGFLGGLVALVRWQGSTILLALAVDVAVARGGVGRGVQHFLAFAAARLGIAAGCALLAFSPQMMAWTILYGRPLLIPQGSDFLRWSSPVLGAVLFSPFRGLLAWTPLTGLAVVGLICWRTHARLVAVLLAFLAINVYVNAAVVDWWAGEAFGARRFLSCFAVFAVGIAALLDTTRRSAKAVTAIAVLVGSNVLLLLHYEAYMLGLSHLVPYPDSWHALWVERYVVPFRLLKYFMQ